ncbi:hypothetical protein D1007_19387 [Hordeum vulgare]|nr:hypothetical protein D1007_19387 [Hordeum vulgare]
MERRAIRARQQTQETQEAVDSLTTVDVGDTGALTTVYVGETESHSPAHHMMNYCGRRNRVLVNVGFFQEGSVIAFTPTSTVRVMSSDEEELGMGDDRSSTPVRRLVSHVLLYLADDWTDITRFAASRRTWKR